MDVISIRTGGLTQAARSPFKRTNRGLTLIELMVTLTIAALLLGLAAPSFSHLLQDSRMSGQLNRLVGALHLTRSEALKRRQTTLLCKSSDGLSCSREAEWHQGWIVFEDQDGDRERDEEEPLLLAEQMGEEGLSISLSAFGSDNYIVYYPTGVTKTNGTFSFCDTRGASEAKALIYYKTGRLRTADTTASGEPIACD